MTRIQLTVLGVLSLLATALVLTSASSGGSKVDLGALAAQRKPATVAAALPGTQADSSDSADDEETAEADNETAANEATTSSEGTTSSDGSGAGSDSTHTDTTDDTNHDSGKTATDEPQPTKIEHVFVIALAGHGFDATFGAGSAATYLNGQLRPKGALLSGYSSLGPADLPDYLAMVGGQPPNAATRAGCSTYTEIPQTNAPSKTGEIAADGCVYPNTVTTIGDQLSASRRSWRAYVEDLEKGPNAKATCRHPDSNAADDTVTGRVGDGYATRHNPFVYFHSLLDLGDCDADDGSLTELEADLKTVKDTPNYSFIAPGLCNDGSESPCADGSPGGLAAADAFLAAWVPKILSSPAYKADGLLIVTFAGDVTPPAAGAAPLAADQPVSNGALLVSRFATAGSTAATGYDPYSLLRSVEDLFALKPLARAAKASSFAPTVLGGAYVTPPSDG